MDMQDNILEMKAIEKYFPGVKALDKVNFSVKRGEVHCLIGANGAGKSTLMKILSGAYTEDGGEIWFDGEKLEHHGTLARKKKGISVIYQELSLVNELDVGENVYINNYPKTKLGTIDWKQVYRQTELLAKRLNIDLNVKKKVSELNVGQRQLTEIMKALAGNAKLIVMDEPSSTLSEKEFEILKKVIKDLKNHGITIIYISHRLEELFTIGERITVMKDGKFVVCRRIEGLNTDMLVEYMTGAKVKKNVFSSVETSISKEVVLELQNISNSKVKNINFKLHKGEILGLYGLLGSGRSEIVRVIFGVDPYDKGKIFLKGKELRIKNTIEAVKNGIGLMPENRKAQGLVLLLPVWENITMVSLKKFLKKGRVDYKNIYEKSEGYKTQLNIITPNIKTPTESLSGGNQQKVIFAKWLSQDSDILMIDEPTQGIDIMTKIEIYRIIKALANNGKSIVVISSELEELLNVCDNLIVMYEGHQVMLAEKGNYQIDRLLQASMMGKNE